MSNHVVRLNYLGRIIMFEEFPHSTVAHRFVLSIRGQATFTVVAQKQP